MPTDLGMKYITRHVLGTCRHTRHFYLDPKKPKKCLLDRKKYRYYVIVHNILTICTPAVYVRTCTLLFLRAPLKFLMNFLVLFTYERLVYGWRKIMEKYHVWLW